MADRGKALADTLSEKIREVIATLEPLSGEQWRRTCSAEGWPVGLVAYHITLAIEHQGGWIEEATRGGEPHRFSWDDTNELNAVVAKAGILPSKLLVLAALPATTERMCGLLRTMTDDQLDQDAFSYNAKGRSAEFVVKVITMRHIEDHASSIRAALADPPSL